MTQTTWDPSDTGSWRLSNDDLTATSPDNNTPQSVFVAFAQNPIPDDAKTYYEYTVSGAAVQTAFTVGFGVHGFNPSAINLADEGAIVPNATFLGFSYNLGIANSGDVDKLKGWIAETLPRTTREVGAWIETECGVIYASRCGLIALLHRLGMEHRKPKTVSSKLDPEKQAAFIKRYENLLNQIGDDEAVLFGDAVHPTHAVRPVGCWAPKDIPLAVPQTSGRQRLNIHGAIDLETGKTRIIEAATVNAVSTIMLLMAIETMYPGKRLIHLFVDNARYHHAKLVQVIYDPQGNVTYAQTHPGAAGSPNRWPNGSVIGVLVDRVDATVQFTLNGVAQGGPFDISGLGDKTVYPFVYSWFKSGPVATINGGTDGFAERLPAGYAALDNGGGNPGGGGGSIVPTSNLITVVQPPGLTVGEDTIVGHEADPTQPVYLSWHNTGSPPSVGGNDVVQATVNTNGNFSATVDLDHAGTLSTMYVGNSGTLAAAWSATPVETSSGGNGTGGTVDDSVVPATTIAAQSQGSQSPSFAAGGSGSATTGNSVTVVQPASLDAGTQNIFGTESDPSQSIFLNWQTYGTPAVGDSGWVEATVHGSGRFFDSVDVDKPGVQGTMFYRIGSGPAVAAWSATPS